MGQNSIKSSLKTIALVLLLAHALTIPWRAYHWIYQGKPFWVATSDVMLTNSVMSSEYLQKVGGAWIVEGGGNLVCRIEISACGDTVNAKMLFIKTFFANLPEWYSLKLSLIGKYWFSSVQNWAGIGATATSADVFINGLLLVAIVFAIFLSVSRRSRADSAWILFVWINASLFSAYALIFTFAHLEVRYFYFPKIAGLVMLLIALGQYLQPARLPSDQPANAGN